MNSPPPVQPVPAKATGRLQDTATVAYRRPASMPATTAFPDRLAEEWCSNMRALVAELRDLRRNRRRV